MPHALHNPATDFRSRAGALEAASVDLVDALADAAAALEATGAVPDDAVVARLRNFQQELAALQADAVRELDPHDRAAGDAIATLDDLGTLLDLVDDVSRQRREVLLEIHRAVEVLDAALSIRHVDDPEFVPLLSCRTAALELKERLQGHATLNVPDEAVELVESRHPIAALVALASNPDGLDDAEWGRCQDLIVSAFGRALATALARGRLTCSRSSP